MVNHVFLADLWFLLENDRKHDLKKNMLTFTIFKFTLIYKMAPTFLRLRPQSLFFIEIFVNESKLTVWYTIL